MGLRRDFPTDPHVVLDPDVRWYPGDDVLPQLRGMLLPPLVHSIRKGVKAWRDAGYEGASATTRALFHHWFTVEHLVESDDARAGRFRYFFCQREAVESAIWLYEVKKARDPYALLRYDESGVLSKGMFDEDWTRYVMKMATGSGKTKVMSLLIAWSYFHRLYEEGSDLSTNFLVVAPNIIVLDRLRMDFEGLRIFQSDPILPENGYEGQHWRDDFQPAVHIQDEIGPLSSSGNLFLTNFHRLLDNTKTPSVEDEDATDFLLGKRPPSGGARSGPDLGAALKELRDLLILNDEAHHIHDPSLAWFQSLREIAGQIRLHGGELSAQFDLTATPKHEGGAIFAQTISDYPLVEAIRQGVVKTPVLPDAASQAKLHEVQTTRFTDRYADYLRLGYLEWQKASDSLAGSGKKPVLFVMTDDTRNCDEVGEWLAGQYPEFRDAVLVIHTKNNGEISEASSGKTAEELEKLRRWSREIDSPASPFKAIVSVMVLREGWDVENVVAIVGLRPFQAKSKILPEQTLGRGLRRMFRGSPVTEKVSVVGTEAFIDFVESIKVEGVDLEYAPMGPKAPSLTPLLVEVDRENPSKDIEKLDIELPILAPRIHREYKGLDDISVENLPAGSLAVKPFTEDQQREIVFVDLDSDEESHRTFLESSGPPSHQAAIGFFTRQLMKELRLVGGQDILFGKIKEFVRDRLFEKPVDLDDPNIIRNLSEVEARRLIVETFKQAVNTLTVRDKGTTEVVRRIKMSRDTRPHVVDQQGYIVPKKSILNRIVGDSHLELQFAAFLETCDDIVSYVKNVPATHFQIEYQRADGAISNYIPDFVVRETETDYCIVETKGREDLDDPPKWERLKQWCKDATLRDAPRRYYPLFVREDAVVKYQPRTFKELRRTCEEIGTEGP
jgi:type III restriction enzyme